GAIPAELAPILERLSLDAAEWLASVQGYERRFRRVVGCAGRLAELARAAGLKWFQGVAACRKLFLPART
ncbi:MAG: transposase, partial [Acidobacteria bacterium]|nr:transposase [Acidobacteriota bacterium]